MNAITERIAHARRNKDVSPSISVQIADTRSPRPIVLDPYPVGDLLELAVTQIVVEGIAKNKLVRWRAKPALWRMRRSFELLRLRPNFLEHVGMHVGDEEIRPAIVVVIKENDSHGSKRRLGKVLRGLFDEFLAARIFVVVRTPHHVQKKQIRPSVAVQIGNRRVTAPADGVQPNFRRNIL